MTWVDIAALELGWLLSPVCPEQRVLRDMGLTRGRNGESPGKPGWVCHPTSSFSSFFLNIWGMFFPGILWPTSKSPSLLKLAGVCFWFLYYWPLTGTEIGTGHGLQARNLQGNQIIWYQLSGWVKTHSLFRKAVLGATGSFLLTGNSLDLSTRWLLVWGKESCCFYKKVRRPRNCEDWLLCRLCGLEKTATFS